jgi:Fic family protein
MIIVAEKVLQNYIQELNTVHGNILDSNLSSDDLGIQIDRVVSFSAWIHHIITYIHPFREGNGRTARLMANLILERYGLVGISVKIEKENKNKYRQCLAQADKNGDLEPLKNLIYEGMTDRYNGAKMKYYL